MNGSRTLVPSYSHVRRCLLPAVTAQRRIVEMQSEGDPQVLSAFQVRQLIDLANAVRATCDSQCQRNCANAPWWAATTTAVHGVQDRLIRAYSDIVTRPLLPTTDIEAKPTIVPEFDVKVSDAPITGLPITSAAGPVGGLAGAVQDQLKPPAAATSRAGKRARSHTKRTAPIPSEIGLLAGMAAAESPEAPPAKQLCMGPSAKSPPSGIQRGSGAPSSSPGSIGAATPTSLPTEPQLAAGVSSTVPAAATPVIAPEVGGARRRFGSALDFHGNYRAINRPAPGTPHFIGSISPVMGTAAPREALRVSAPSSQLLSRPVSLPSPGPDIAAADVQQPLRPASTTSPATPAALSTAAAHQYYVPLAGYYQATPSAYGYMYGGPAATAAYPMMAPAQYAAANAQLYYGAATNPYAAMMQTSPQTMGGGYTLTRTPPFYPVGASPMTGPRGPRRLGGPQ